MPNEIEQKMDAMAEKLAKASQDPGEALIKTIETLGKAGLKAKLPHLSTEQKTIIKSALEVMSMRKSKSVDLDKEARGAKVIEGKLVDTKIQEEVANDDADEKLVKPEAAKHSHQGNSIDGWEGQVIKSEKPKESNLMGHTMTGKPVHDDPAHEAHKEFSPDEHEEAASMHDRIARPIQQKMMQQPMDESDEGKAEREEMKPHLEKHGKAKLTHMKMAMDKCMGMMKSFKQVEDKAKKEGASNPAAVAAEVGFKKLGKEEMERRAEAGKKKSMKKSSEDLLEQMTKSEDVLFKAVCAMCKKGMKHSEIEKKLSDKGMDKAKVKKALDRHEAEDKIMDMEEKEHGTKDPKKLVEKEKKEHKAEKEMKSVMKKGDENAKRILAEEDQLGNTKQMAEEGKDLEDDTQDPAKANKKTQAQVNDVKEIKKSVTWIPKNELEALTLGRNFTFNVGEWVEKALAAEADLKKSETVVEKSEKKDLNDLIALGEDTTWAAEQVKKSLAEASVKRSGNLVKSFGDDDMAAAMGLTPEEAKKILG